MSHYSDRRLGRSTFVAALLLVAMAASTQAEGWKFWEPKETTSDDGLGGTPYANSAKANRSPRSSGISFPSAPSNSGGWNVGAGVSNATKSVVNGTSNAVSKTAYVTKKAAKKTVDLVTLKPLWGSKPAPNPYQLGSHPDPRSKGNANKPALWGASSRTKSEPSTPSQFFSQPRVK